MESEAESETANLIGSVSDSSSRPDDLAERKARLLRQASLYRVGIVHARANIQQGARPEVLFHRVLDYATWSLRARIDGMLRPTGVSVASMAPYALTVLGFLRRRRLVKPALVAAAAVGALAWAAQRRQGNSVKVA